MPIKDLFGGQLPRDQVFEGKLAANPAATIAPNVEIDREFRNGRAPSATGYNQLAEAANIGALYRTREYFSSPGYARVESSFGAGDRARFRFAMRTGSYAHAMGVMVILAPQSSGFDQPARVRLDIATNAAGTPAVLTREFVYGASGGIDASINNFKTEVATIDGLTPNTDYFCTAYDVDHARLVAMSCWELASLTSVSNGGYLAQNFAAGTPILDVYRANLFPQVRAVWTTGAAKLFTWTADDGTDPRLTTSASALNLIDQTTATVSATSPGFTLDMRYRARASQTSGVPCVIKAYGNMSVGATGGLVELKDSGGAVLATCSGWSNSGAAEWRSTTVNLPATQAKYDACFRTTAGTFRCYAVSMWQQD